VQIAWWWITSSTKITWCGITSFHERKTHNKIEISIPIA